MVQASASVTLIVTLSADLVCDNEMFILYKISGGAARAGIDLFSTFVILIFTLTVVDEAQLQVSVVMKSVNTQAQQFLKFCS